jgi:hypothetical protein
MNSIDGNILYQSIDPLTKTVSPEFYQQFESIGQETLNLFIELKIVMTSNFTRRDENIVNFMLKLDSQLPNLPTPIQTWFKKFYKIRISNEIKGKVLEKGSLKSLDKTFSFDAMNRVVDVLNWFTPNTVTPYNALEQKVPCGMGTIPKITNSADTALYASKKMRLQVCKNRAVNALMPKIATPDKSHGQPNVGDYEHPKRMGKVATEYQTKIQQLLGVNAKYVMDNLNFKPSANNVQTGAPDIRIPTKIGDKTVNATIYGPVNKDLEAKNPFLPKRIV